MAQNSILNEKLSDDKKENQNNVFSRGIDNLERLALSIGLSIVIIPLIGFGLNYLWELTLVPITVTLFCLTLIFSGIAWYRRIRFPEEDRFFITLVFNQESAIKSKTEKNEMIIAILSVVLSLIILIGAMAFVILTPTSGGQFTELYCLDQNHTLEDLPTNMTVNETGTIIIGVSCHENELSYYSVLITITNATGEICNQSVWSYNITLSHEEENEITHEFQINETGDYLLMLELFKAPSQAVYQECHIWVHII